MNWQDEQKKVATGVTGKHWVNVECPLCGDMAVAHTHPVLNKREWVGPSSVEHWCTYCQGHNSHNCQFNTNFPRIQTYVTNTTNPPKREWVGLTPADFDKLEQLFGNKVSNDFVFADIVCVISAKLKEKNT